MGEIDEVGDGRRRPRLLRRPRGLLPRPGRRSPTGTSPTSASAAARSTSGTRASPGSNNQNPAKITKVADLTVFGAKGGGAEYRPDLQDRAGHPRHRPGPRLHQRPPVHLRPVPPVLRRRAGQGHDDPKHRPGLRPRHVHGRAAASQRFTYDDATKTLVPGSEKVIFHYMTQVYCCCHLGGGWTSTPRATCTSPPATTRTAPRQRPNNQSNNKAATPTRTRTSRSRAPATAPRPTAATSRSRPRPADTGR